MARLPYSEVAGKLITFLSSDRLLLNGFLTERHGSRDCMIYVHGMGGNFYSGILSKAIAQGALKAGYSTFAINTRGHDLESSAKVLSGRNGRRLPIGTKLERFEDCARDIGGAIAAMRKLGYRRFTLAGHSTGCQKVLYYLLKTTDRSVRTLVLLAPDDDYNLNRKKLGRRCLATVSLAKKMMADGRRNSQVPGTGFSAQRFLSIADLKRPEARLFNYDGELAEFGRIRAPVFVAFGTRDEGAVKPVSAYVRILKEHSGSRKFGYLLIRRATHSFTGYEKRLAAGVSSWLRTM